MSSREANRRPNTALIIGADGTVRDLVNEGVKTESSSSSISYTDRSGDTGTASTSSEIAPENSSRKVLLFQNISDSTIYINFGAVATIDSDSIKIESGSMLSMTDSGAPSGSVNVICSSASKKFVCKEF